MRCSSYKYESQLNETWRERGMAVQAQNNLPSVLAMPASASSSLFFHCYSKEFLVCSRQTFANDIVLMPLLLHSNLDGRRHCFRYYVEKLNCRWIFHFWLYPIIFKNYLYYLFLQILDLLAVACIASIILDRDNIWLSTGWVYIITVSSSCFECSEFDMVPPRWVCWIRNRARSRYCEILVTVFFCF